MERSGKRKRLPKWARRRLGQPSRLHEIKSMLRAKGLHTVCESAKCPNIGECFSKPTATFMILGDKCTRRCGFCNVDNLTDLPAPDGEEPLNIALAAKELGLRHVVITSVTRDDLTDGGSAHFALTIKAIRDNIPDTSIEVLIPDFGGDKGALDRVIEASPDIFNHNIETMRSLYKRVRPEADYERSLEVLSYASSRGMLTKSGFMVGLGEESSEIEALLADLARAGCDIVTIGQYLSPSQSNLEVVEYVEPALFEEYAAIGRSLGISYVYAGPFVRSSYNAEEVFRSRSVGA